LDDKKKLIYLFSFVVGILLGLTLADFVFGDFDRLARGRLSIDSNSKFSAHKGFCPNVSDRKFWDGIQKKPLRLSRADFLMATNSPQWVLVTGTQQLLFYPEDSKWLPFIQESIVKLTRPEDADFSSFLGIQYTTDLALVANTIQLLEPLFPVEFVQQVKSELRGRVVYPFLEDFNAYQISPLKTRNSSCRWLERNDNWKAVCLSNIVYVTWIVEDDPKTIFSVLEAARYVAEEYLDSFEQDGYFSGGMRYWAYGFSHYILLAESVLQMTKGSLNLYDHPLVPLAVSYPYKTKISRGSPFKGSVFPLFGDNSNPVVGYEWVEDALRARFTGREFSFGDNSDFLGSRSFLAPYFLNSPFLDFSLSKISLPRESEAVSYYPSSQFVLFNDPAGSLVLVLKGGHNGEEHNHNDVGSYTLFNRDLRGVYALLGDLGAEEYQLGHFFSDLRYTFDGMGSHGHPLPIFNNVLQSDGAQARATVVADKTDLARGIITLDLTSCYNAPGLKSIYRTISFVGGRLTVRDSFEAYHPVSFETVIPTVLNIENSNGLFTLGGFGTRLAFSFRGSSLLKLRSRPSKYHLYAQIINLTSSKLESSGYIEYEFTLKGPGAKSSGVP
jgi:hypothetical protein